MFQRYRYATIALPTSEFFFAPKARRKVGRSKRETVEAGIELNSRDAHLLPIGKGYIA